MLAGAGLTAAAAAAAAAAGRARDARVPRQTFPGCMQPGRRFGSGKPLDTAPGA